MTDNKLMPYFVAEPRVSNRHHLILDSTCGAKPPPETSPTAEKGEFMKLRTKMTTGDEGREKKGWEKKEGEKSFCSLTLVQSISDATVVRVNKTFWTEV
ncbi:hypothetical protein WISP_41973 [Willisornis vidua]|uniref:Uncharacterized protein n=1 Tax=Willisornis vidua TaxID=1566151 RepID=A0ABQ9DHW4_9PASS|nr:hypothetical protein WISP_41973 [Willisornis vidua]